MKLEVLNIGSSDAILKNCLNIDINHDVVTKLDVAADMKALPFKNETFKGVIASHVLEHVAQWGHESCIFECWRVLKPNGKLYIEVPNFVTVIKSYLENYLGQKQKWHEFIFGRRAFKGDEHNSGIDEEYLCDLLFKFGFTKLKWNRGSKRMPILGVYAVKGEIPDWEI